MARARLRPTLGRACACALLATLVGAAPAAATPLLGSIATLAGGYPAGPVAATSVGQLPVAVATVSGSAYVYVADSANSVVTRVNETTGAQQLVAGVGAAGYSGDGGPATQAALRRPTGVAVDGGGDVFIGDGGARVRFIPATSGTFYGQAMTAGDIYTIAGNGTAGFSGDGGPAASAQIDIGPYFMLPGGHIAVDGNGDLALAELPNQRVRFVPMKSGSFFGRAMTGGDIYTIAGNGKEGFSGDGGAGTSAELALPIDVAFDGAGNVAIADVLNERVRFLSSKAETQFGQAMSIGDIYTVAGNGKGKYAGEGVPATESVYQPFAVAFDPGNNLAISESGEPRIRFVPRSSGGFFGKAMTANDIYTIAGNGTFGFSGDGAIAAGAEISQAEGIAFDPAGSLVIADTGNRRLRFEPASKGVLFGSFREEDDIYTVAGNGAASFSGDGHPATESQLGGPGAVALDPLGGFAIADFANNRIRLVAGGAGVFGQAMIAGSMYTIAGNGEGGFGGDGGLGTSAKLSEPEGVTFDGGGDLVIGDRFNHRVRFMPASSGSFFGQAMTANDIYTIAGNGIGGFGGDGGPATSAELREPAGVKLDAHGDVIVADAENKRVRFIPSTSGTFYGQAMIADRIYTIAGNGKEGFGGDGGPATAAELHGVWDVGVDAAGDVAITDSENQRVRFVPASTGSFFGQAMAADHIYTIAGNGSKGFSGDGGAATAAQLEYPLGVDLDPVGDLAIADEGSNHVRLVPVHDGTYFGKAMSANDIYTIAGNGTAGFSGDGGAATAAELAQPEAPIFDGAGDVLFIDSENNRVRIVYATGSLPGGEPERVVGGGAGGGQPSASARAPTLSAVRQSASTWREGSRLARITRARRRLPVGTTFSFAVDESATVSLRFTQKLVGHRRGRRCVAGKPHRGHGGCILTVTVATIGFAAHPGTNRMGFQGRVSRTRKLRPGRYTLILGARNAAGASPSHSLTFTIVR